MVRRTAAVLACALMVFGQRSRSDSPAPPSDLLVVDAVAVDAAGRPVTDLTAGDFEVVQGGSTRKITNFTWFDTRLHTSVSRTGQVEQLPALDLLPDEIRRNLVVVVDDLGLTPGGIQAVHSGLRTFAAKGMSSGDRVAILRSSGGSGALEQLSGNARTLLEAIDGIRYLGGGTSAASAGKATWMALGSALDGLRDFAGRKVVVVFAENPRAAGPWIRPEGQAVRAANAAGAAVYVLDPLAPAAGTGEGTSVLESLARDTGGWAGGDFAGTLEREQGYYAIGFLTDAQPSDEAGPTVPAAPAVLKVRRPGVGVRSRAGYIRQHPREELLVPPEHAALLSTALRSPFAGSDIRTRLTAVFTDYAAVGPSVDVTIQFDARDFSLVRDLEGVYHGGVQLKVTAHMEDGRATTPVETDMLITQQDEDHRYAIENGMSVSSRMRLPGPGGWQIHAVVADDGSDRIGSARQFVEIPDVRQSPMAISGLILSGDTWAGGGATADPKSAPGLRIFRRHQSCTFQYCIFNAMIGLDKHSSLEVQTRIFHDGQMVFDGKPGQLDFGEAPVDARRQIVGHLTLGPQIGPGDYILQVTVRDLLAPAGAPRTATQFTDFEVRD